MPIRALGGALFVALAVTACGSPGAEPTPGDPTAAAAVLASDDETAAGAGLFDSSVVHGIGIDFDRDDYEEMVATFAASGSKEWIEARVTIDGAVYERAGIRLKGNSSLMGLRGGPDGRGAVGGEASSDEPERLPWLIRLDRYVDGQSHHGIYDLVVRSNNSETSLNEAVAVELLQMAGLASQDAIAVRFSVNDGPDVLRLVIEHPDDVWMAEAFSARGALYKAESTGDYSYRGDDPAAYDEVFDQEAGEENADLTPLIEFLAFVNQSDDATFAADLAGHLDVESFATYLAVQDLIDNFDDIDGPGNNSYLYYDPGTDRFTVVPWDHNLAFGGFGNGGRLPQGQQEEGVFEGAPRGFDGEPPEGFEGQPPAPGFDRGGPGGFGGPGNRAGSNVLSERFLAVDEFAVLYEERLAELRTTLYDSGAATEVLEAWVEVITAQAADLVDPDTVADEAAAVAAVVDGIA